MLFFAFFGQKELLQGKMAEIFPLLAQYCPVLRLIIAIFAKTMSSIGCLNMKVHVPIVHLVIS